MQDGQCRTVRQFQFMDWPEQGVPPSGEGFIELIGQVHKTKEQFGHEGPIIVHCRSVGEPVSHRSRVGKHQSWIKLAFHDTDTDTDFLADILARIVARMSACR